MPASSLPRPVPGTATMQVAASSVQRGLSATWSRCQPGSCCEEPSGALHLTGSLTLELQHTQAETVRSPPLHVSEHRAPKTLFASTTTKLRVAVLLAVLSDHCGLSSQLHVVGLQALMLPRRVVCQSDGLQVGHSSQSRRRGYGFAQSG